MKQPFELPDPTDTTLQLRALDGEARLTLRCIEVTRQPYPSLGLQVALRKGDFAGINPTVRLDEPSLSEFIRRLSDLHSGRDGGAVLSAMSPGEFELRLHASGNTGPLLVTATVTRPDYLGHPPALCIDSTTLHFELDRADLRQALDEFRALLALSDI